MRLDPKALGLAAGLLWGGGLFAITLFVTFTAGTGEHLNLLSRFYIGYSVSVLGAVLGAAWGFVEGFIGGWLLGWLYNKLAKA